MNFLDVHNGTKLYGIGWIGDPFCKRDAHSSWWKSPMMLLFYNGETEVSSRAEINHLQVLDVQ